MGTVTYVSLVPKDQSEKLRNTLSQEDTGPLSWREQKSWRGSEFYFTGPPDLVRQTHEFVTLWLAKEKLSRTSRH